ncbi:metal ABC transporter permease [soil metagenome]
MSPAAEIQFIAVVTAAACALPGVFLVLRRSAMLSDAISHAVLPGIVIGFLVTHDLSSPWLVIGATATGVLAVVLIETLVGTRLVKTDAAIGLVFPVLFSIGVVLIAQYAQDVHLDTDAVLLGDPAFAWIERFEVGGRDLGPRSLWLMGTLLTINAAFIAVFYKELKLAAFDPALAATLGYRPRLLHYALMTLVAATCVGAFDVVGSVLVVALIVAPPAAAYLLTDRLPLLIGLAAGIGGGSALGGYGVSRALDASIAGAMASAAGVAFLLAFLFAPEYGLVSRMRRRSDQRARLTVQMLTVHLLHHEQTPDAPRECTVSHLTDHLRWEPDHAQQAARAATRRHFVTREGDRLRLTESGRELAREAMVR